MTAFVALGTAAWAQEGTPPPGPQPESPEHQLDQKVGNRSELAVPETRPEPMPDWRFGQWFAATAWGSLGGLAGAATAGAIGLLVGAQTCPRPQETDQWFCNNALVAGFAGALVGATIGAPIGSTIYGRTTPLSSGSYAGALLGAAAGAGLSAGLTLGMFFLGDQSFAGGMNLVYVGIVLLPALGAASGYYLSARRTNPSRGPAMSLVHYDERAGFGLGLPILLVSANNGDRRAVVPVLSGSF